MDITQSPDKYLDRRMVNFTISASSGMDLMEPWQYYLAAFVLFLIGFFGFTLNFLVIVLMCRDSQLWTPMNIILFNLVCADFLVSIFGNPLTLTAALSHGWIFGRNLCVAYGFFMALLGITSITTLTVLSYERYCLVVFPLANRKITNGGAVILIFFIWLYSLALTTPPLIGWGKYVNEAANISCSVNWESKTYNATSYIVFLFIFGLVVPVIVISYSYINIIRTMKTNALKLGRTRNRAERRVTIMVAVMISAFMIAWTPYSIFALIEQFGPSDWITPKMAVLPALIAKSSICYNPLIYVGLNTQFRASLKRRIVKESTVIETTVNQISQTGSSHELTAVDCAPKIVRHGRVMILKSKKYEPSPKGECTAFDLAENDCNESQFMSKQECGEADDGDGRSAPNEEQRGEMSSESDNRNIFDNTNEQKLVQRNIPVRSSF